MGQKWHFCTNRFSRVGHKTGKTGRFLYCRVYLVSQKHIKTLAKVRIDFGRKSVFSIFFPYKITPPEKKTRTQRYEIFSWPKKLKKSKSVKNGQQSSQNARNRSGKKICILLRASNRPLDGVKCEKVVKKHVFWGLDPQIG